MVLHQLKAGHSTRCSSLIDDGIVRWNFMNKKYQRNIHTLYLIYPLYRGYFPIYQ